jgi:hypothetical protein
MVKEICNIQKQHPQHSKNNTRKHRDLLLQHYNMEKIMAQHQLMLRATWSRIPQHSKTNLQHSKKTSATSRSNFTTLQHRDLFLQQPRETLATFL